MALEYSLAIMLGLGFGLGVFIYEYVQQASYKRYQQSYQYGQHDTIYLINFTPSPQKAISAKSIRRRNKPKKEEEEKICVICSKPILGNFTVLACKHRYHENCIKEWFELCKTTKCPYGCS